MTAAPDEKLKELRPANCLCGGPVEMHKDKRPCRLPINMESPKPPQKDAVQACPACGRHSESTWINREPSNSGDRVRRECCCGYCGPWRNTKQAADVAWDAMPRRGDKDRLLDEIHEAVCGNE